MCGRLVNLDTVARVLADYYHLKTETQLAALNEALSRVPTETVGDSHKKDHVADPGNMVVDLISRQAAIDVVEKWFEKIGLNPDICIDGLISLPSAQPEPIRINLNETIKVKLTDLGKKIYYHQHDRTNQIAGIKICEPKFPEEDENGYTEIQLWVFIELYGEHIGVTLPNVIKPNEIVYER